MQKTDPLVWRHYKWSISPLVSVLRSPYTHTPPITCAPVVPHRRRVLLLPLRLSTLLTVELRLVQLIPTLLTHNVLSSLTDSAGGSSFQSVLPHGLRVHFWSTMVFAHNAWEKFGKAKGTPHRAELFELFSNFEVLLQHTGSVNFGLRSIAGS